MMLYREQDKGIHQDSIHVFRASGSSAFSEANAFGKFRGRVGDPD